MKIVTLGKEMAMRVGGLYENIALLGDKHLGDVDVFLVELEAVGDELIGKSGKRQIRKALYQHYSQMVYSRMSEVRKVCEAGSPVIVFLRSMPTIFEVEDEYGVKWLADWAEFWPYTEVTLNPSSGNSLKSRSKVGNSLFSDRQVTDIGFSVCIMGKADGFPLLEVPTKIKDKVKFASWVIPIGKGYVVFLPVDLLMDDDSQSAILRIVDDVKKEIAARRLAIQRPTWLQSASDKIDSPLVKTLDDHSSSIRQLQEDSEAIRAKLERTEWKYGLLFESGASLEECVRRALTELGATIESGPNGRADFVGLVGKTLIYGEVKGLDGAAPESALIQLAKWKAEVEEALFHWEESEDELVNQYHGVLKRLDVYDEFGKAKPGIELKGMIVANTFRQRSLNERPSLSERKHENFSVIFESKLTSSNWVAITSFQLLSMLNFFFESEAQQFDWTQLIATNGIFGEYRDTHDFLVFGLAPQTDRENS